MRTERERPHRRPPLRSGIFLFDVLAGFTLLVALMLVSGVAISRHEQGMRALTDSRAATRLAEGVLLELQAGRVPQAAGEDASFEVAAVADAPAATGGLRWVEVRASRRGQAARIVGFVPAGGAR